MLADFRTDGILIPNRHKSLPIVRNTGNKYDKTFEKHLA